MFVHNVFFYLKDGTPDATRDAIAQDARTQLAKIPGVRHVWAGAPAMIERDVIDNTYGVGLTVVFDDRAGHDVYQAHPLHKQFVDRNKPHWTKIKVYDFR